MKRDAKFRKPRTIFAVRGPYTRHRCLELGIECPEIFGDPGILLPHFLALDEEPVCEIGVVPHFVDYEDAVRLFSFDPSVRVINVLDEMSAVVKRIVECRAIISSSLHGIIVANAFGRPALRALFSDRIKGDGVKYLDYSHSVSPEYHINSQRITDTEDAKMAIRRLQSAEPPPSLLELQRKLIAACPFAVAEYVPMGLRPN